MSEPTPYEVVEPERAPMPETPTDTKPRNDGEHQPNTRNALWVHGGVAGVAGLATLAVIAPPVALGVAAGGAAAGYGIYRMRRKKGRGAAAMTRTVKTMKSSGGTKAGGLGGFGAKAAGRKSSLGSGGGARASKGKGGLGSPRSGGLLGKHGKGTAGRGFGGGKSSPFGKSSGTRGAGGTGKSGGLFGGKGKAPLGGKNSSSKAGGRKAGSLFSKGGAARKGFAGAGGKGGRKGMFGLSAAGGRRSGMGAAAGKRGGMFSRAGRGLKSGYGRAGSKAGKSWTGFGKGTGGFKGGPSLGRGPKLRKASAQQRAKTGRAGTRHQFGWGLGDLGFGAVRRSYGWGGTKGEPGHWQYSAAKNGRAPTGETLKQRRERLQREARTKRFHDRRYQQRGHARARQHGAGYGDPWPEDTTIHGESREYTMPNGQSSRTSTPPPNGRAADQPADTVRVNSTRGRTHLSEPDQISKAPLALGAGVQATSSTGGTMSEESSGPFPAEIIIEAVNHIKATYKPRNIADMRSVFDAESGAPAAIRALGDLLASLPEDLVDEELFEVPAGSGEVLMSAGASLGDTAEFLSDEGMSTFNAELADDEERIAKGRIAESLDAANNEQ